jgi:Tol biopolymer transport system component
VGGGRAPVWSRDGRQLAYTAPSTASSKAGIYVRAVDQTGSPQLVYAAENTFAATWLPLDRGLVFSTMGLPRTRDDVGVITLGDSVPRWLLTSEFAERHPVLSHDGGRLAFTSNRTGRQEVYVRPLAGDAAAVQISTDGASSARWGRDGTLFYVNAGQNAIVAATLAPGVGIEVTSRRVVMADGIADLNTTNVNWDVLPDGKQFLHINRSGSSAIRMVMIQNWVELARSLGAAR